MQSKVSMFFPAARQHSDFRTGVPGERRATIKAAFCFMLRHSICFAMLALVLAASLRMRETPLTHPVLHAPSVMALLRRR